MLILDTINLNWGKGSLVNAPSPRNYYGGALLPNNSIIYMGKQVILAVLLKSFFIFLRKKMDNCIYLLFRWL